MYQCHRPSARICESLRFVSAPRLLIFDRSPTAATLVVFGQHLQTDPKNLVAGLHYSENEKFFAFWSVRPYTLKMDHHELMKIRASVEADLLKTTKDTPVFVDELGKKYDHHELGMVELIKSLQDEKFPGIQLERNADGRMITWFKIYADPNPQPTRADVLKKSTG
jgi:hypothetical protein